MPPKAPRGEYIETDTGNKVSRRAQIHGTTNIVLGGRTVIQAEAVLRGDLVRTIDPTQSTSKTTGVAAGSGAGAPATLAISIGKYTFVSTGAVLHPARKLHRGAFSHHPQKIGDHVFIGAGAIVEAASIGSNVWIGPGVVIGRLAIIRDMAKILEGAVVAPGTVIGAGEVFAGRPARKVGDIGWGEGWEGRELWRSIR